ncbi:hypothetical protein VP01_3304g1 [Puccinia sorghi]|uniref:Uncharacterized protein n=1 Tax=Puccinia sorghi TaxID=27349 RepID=A0A0L6UXH4_9BASI|nr:hypothetical protein VP01_3304g1 [Puccinia sorghi]
MFFSLILLSNVVFLSLASCIIFIFTFAIERMALVYIFLFFTFINGNPQLLGLTHKGFRSNIWTCMKKGHFPGRESQLATFLHNHHVRFSEFCMLILSLQSTCMKGKNHLAIGLFCKKVHKIFWPLGTPYAPQNINYSIDVVIFNKKIHHIPFAFSCLDCHVLSSGIPQSYDWSISRKFDVCLCALVGNFVGTSTWRMNSMPRRMTVALIYTKLVVVEPGRFFFKTSPIFSPKHSGPTNINIFCLHSFNRSIFLYLSSLILFHFPSLLFLEKTKNNNKHTVTFFFYYHFHQSCSLVFLLFFSFNLFLYFHLEGLCTRAAHESGPIRMADWICCVWRPPANAKTTAPLDSVAATVFGPHLQSAGREINRITALIFMLPTSVELLLRGDRAWKGNRQLQLVKV